MQHQACSSSTVRAETGDWGRFRRGGTLTVVSQGSGKHPTPAAAVYPKGELGVPVRIPVGKSTSSKRKHR